MKKNFIICIFLVLFIINLFATYTIELSYDTFEGECVGFLSGSQDGNYGFVPGEEKDSLNGVLIAETASAGFGDKKIFRINSDRGHYSFWIRDQFGDQDFAPDYDLITKVKPKIKVFKDDRLIESIKIEPGDGSGLTCKVFELYAETDTILIEKRFYEKTRLILGRVVNAVDGKPLQNVLVTNQMLDETIKTDGNGIFIFDVPFGEFGEHYLNLSKKDFISGQTSVNFRIDENPREIIFAMSPKIDKYRIVLTWGARPYDLDAHLTGPKPEGGKFHIWYRNRVLISGKDFLDRDDTHSYGPETITIYKPAKGEYRYSVHNYSNRNSTRGKYLSRSGAKVFIYADNRLVQSFAVPTDKVGNTWNVFEINKHNKIVPINQIKNVRNESDIH